MALRFAHDLIDAAEISITLIPGGEMVTVTTEAVAKWAGRGVLRPTDQIELDNDSRLNINLARYTVRHDSRIESGQTMIDESGATRTILGMQPLGRRDYLDLLCERIS